MPSNFFTQLKSLCFLTLIAGGTMQAWGQPSCPNLSSTSLVVEGSRVKAVLNSGNNLFSDQIGGSFLVRADAQDLSNEIATFFAANVWVGATNAAGELGLLAPTFQSNNNNVALNPGPLDPVTGIYNPDLCQPFNRLWAVKRHEIAQHLADLADNGVIDEPLASVMGWPGKGNPYFESVNGFALPYPNEDMAPFYDADNNGVYDPTTGDYPSVNLGDQTPENLVWSVNNTNAIASTNNINLEIRQLVWTYACEEDSPLNRGVFVRTELINRGLESLFNTIAGIWSDPDLGCYTDDYIGSYPAGNSCFIYNADDIDGSIGCDCVQGGPSFCDVTPIQNITLLNRDMSSFIGYYNTSFANLPPEASDPSAPEDYYNFLQGRWRDGSPITTGGSGYMSGGEPTQFLFPGNPANTDEWSLASSGFLAGGSDVRTLINSDLGEFLPGEKKTLDYAFTFHIDPNEPIGLGQIDVMYGEIDWLQAWYDAGATNGCTPLEVCQNDCVWAGDANNDGIANHFDMLPVMAGRTGTGPLRQPPYDWAPRSGALWALNMPGGVNFKHIDCNGNGEIEAEDYTEVSESHYGLVNTLYFPSFNYPEGAEILVEATGNNSFDNFGPGFFTSVRIKLNTNVDVHTLAYTLEYDTAYFKPVNGAFAPNNTLSTTHFRPGEIDMAVAAEQVGANLNSGILFTFPLAAKSAYPNPLPSNKTYLRLRNLSGLDVFGETVSPLGAEPVEVTFSGITVGTRDISALPLQLYPNPAFDQIHVSLAGEGPKTACVFDSQGRQMTPALQFSGNNTSISCVSWPQGLYIITISDQSGQVSTGRWIKK